MQIFGVLTLVFAAFIIVLWAASPVFFTAYIVPWAIFIAIIFVGIATLIMASGKANKSKK